MGKGYGNLAASISSTKKSSTSSIFSCNFWYVKGLSLPFYFLFSVLCFYFPILVLVT